LRAEQPSFLFVGLGETDEFAHQGNYAGYLEALREADRYIGELAAELSRRARNGVRTALFVTADHGRAATFRDHGQSYPESARVWLVASGSAIEARGLVAAAVPRQLADIAPTVRALFGLPADRDQNAGFPLFELLGPAHK
jgi:phosphopentomutase